MPHIYVQGGMKAVIMTDTFQAAVLLGSIIAVLAIGVVYSEGLTVIWKRNVMSNRIEPLVFDPDPTIRHSVWSVVVGGTVYWATMFCASQASIQKYLSVESILQVRRALWVSCVSLIVVFSMNFCIGMIMYAVYYDCDPLISKTITASDQLLPLYVMHSLGHLKGIPGLFVAGIFAASLGTVASAMNSLAAVTIKDFLNCLCNITIPEQKGAMASKWLSAVFGLISFGLIFVVERLGSILQVALSLNGMAGGVVLGLFSLGMFFPWANSRGALIGATTSLAFVVWIGLSNQIAISNNLQTAIPKVRSAQGCVCNITTEETNELFSENEVFSLFRISYLWYSSIGFSATIVLGMVVSLLSGPQDPGRVHPDLISPPILAFFKTLPNPVKESLNLPLESKENVENVIKRNEDNL
uniref:Sodium/solute symporter n=1 Tax=Clastoptera arizonana TaxID=38151 RepID=A0A1B6D2P4_9HEMI